MKRFLKFGAAAVLGASAVVASFAFTSKEETAVVEDVYFIYNGPDNSVPEVTDPLNYTVSVNAPQSGSTYVKLSGLYLTTSLHVYPSGSGIVTGKPKVDIPSAFQTALLDATDITPREFREPDFDIYLKP